MSESPLRPPRMSAGVLFLGLAVGGLIVGNLLTLQRLAAVERKLEALQTPGEPDWPLPAAEVARQFAEKTSLGSLSVKVADVRYSLEKDTYRVAYSWTNRETGKTWSSDVRLEGDGFGVYFGQIRNDPFIEPLGYKECFSVAVSKPSPLQAMGPRRT